MRGDRVLAVRQLGLTDYSEVHALQRQLQAARADGNAPDTLLLTQHHPVITLGRAHPEPDLRVSQDALQRQGIPIVQAERGGNITYHGPGQMVAYGIIDLHAWDLDLLAYVTGLEEATICTLRDFDIDAHREKARGVWVASRKIASIGIHVRRRVTMHGIAVNVDPRMEHFALINPCGMPGVEMTAIAAECGHPIDMASVEQKFLKYFCRVFGCQMQNLVRV